MARRVVQTRWRWVDEEHSDRYREARAEPKRDYGTGSGGKDEKIDRCRLVEQVTDRQWWSCISSNW